MNSDVVETVLTNNGTNMLNDTATSFTVNNVTLAKEYHSIKNLSTIVPPQGAAKQQTDVELIPSAESNKVLKEVTNSRENEALTKNETRSSSTAKDQEESMSAQTVSVSSFSERKGQLKINATDAVNATLNATSNATLNATTEATSPESVTEQVTQKSLPTTTARTRRPTTAGNYRRRKSTTTTSTTTTTTTTTTEAPEVETTIKSDDSVGSESAFGEYKFHIFKLLV